MIRSLLATGSGLALGLAVSAFGQWLGDKLFPVTSRTLPSTRSPLGAPSLHLELRVPLGAEATYVAAYMVAALLAAVLARRVGERQRAPVLTVGLALGLWALLAAADIPTTVTLRLLVAAVVVATSAVVAFASRWPSLV